MKRASWNVSGRPAGAVKIRDEEVLDTQYDVTADSGMIKAGRKFIRIIG